VRLRLAHRLGVPAAAVVQRLFPEQARDVVDPVTPLLLLLSAAARLTAQRERRARQALAEPQLKRLA